jgi:hypothetical protein
MPVLTSVDLDVGSDVFRTPRLAFVQEIRANMDAMHETAIPIFIADFLDSFRKHHAARR